MGKVEEVEIEITDNHDLVGAALKKAIARGLEAIGFAAEDHAKKICPYDTGRLRDSITHTQDSDAAYIGTNVEYAPYVELGTSKQNARPFLRPAATEHSSEYKKLMEESLKNG